MPIAPWRSRGPARPRALAPPASAAPTSRSAACCWRKANTDEAHAAMSSAIGASHRGDRRRSSGDAPGAAARQPAGPASGGGVQAVDLGGGRSRGAEAWLAASCARRSRSARSRSLRVIVGGALEFGACFRRAIQLHQQVASHRWQQVIALQRFLRDQRVDDVRALPAGPKAIDTATARLSSTTGDGDTVPRIV